MAPINQSFEPPGFSGRESDAAAVLLPGERLTATCAGADVLVGGGEGEEARGDAAALAVRRLMRAGDLGIGDDTVAEMKSF